jgi:hypothetical protein
MAANQSIRKRLLEEKLGLNQNDIIKSGFDQETVSIVWDIVNKRYDTLEEHPLIAKDDDESWPDWVFFLVVHNTHASIWAIEEKHLATVNMTDQDYLTNYDVSACLKPTSIVHRFHVVIRSDDRYYVQTDKLTFYGKQPEFDICVYVGTLTLSLLGINVIMAMVANGNYLLLQSDCLGYCKDFVMKYFDMIEEELTPEHLKMLDCLTVTTNPLSAASERSGRQNPTSGWSLRLIITSTLVQVYIGTVLAGISLYLLYRVFPL